MTKQERTERGEGAKRQRTSAAATESQRRDLAVGARGYSGGTRKAVQSGAGAYLGELSQRDDGWLRWTRKRDTDTVFAKWKFTHGSHARHYVMAVGENWQVDYILQLLLLKLDKVDAGDLTDLARDTFYNNSLDEVGRD